MKPYEVQTLTRGHWLTAPGAYFCTRAEAEAALARMRRQYPAATEMRVKCSRKDLS